MPSLILDNFLPYPNVVRGWAIQQEYFNAEQFSQRYNCSTSWPGIRTDHVMDLDMNYANNILSRISSIAQQVFSVSPDVGIKSYFQICSADDGDSWIHQDNDVTIAAILYLNPDAPVTAGTSLYRCNDIQAWGKLSMADMQRINRVERKDLYDSLFTETDVIGNVFNRLVMYDGDTFHKSNDYFGTTKEDSRLTQVFFLTANG